MAGPDVEEIVMDMLSTLLGAAAASCAGMTPNLLLSTAELFIMPCSCLSNPDAFPSRLHTQSCEALLHMTCTTA